MRTIEMLQALVRSFVPLPPGAQLCLLRPPVEGRGGKWQAAIWFAGSNAVCAVIVPWDGCCPIAINVVWSDELQAAEAAQRFACLAAEVEYAEA
mgnify:CR=1 FL=1